MLKKILNDDWKWWTWVFWKNSGGNKDAVFQVLLNHGFDFDSISKELNYTPTNDFILNRKSTQLNLNKEPNVIIGDLCKNFADNPNFIRIDSNDLEIYYSPAVLTQEECDKIISEVQLNEEGIKYPNFENFEAMKVANSKINQACKITDKDHIDFEFIKIPKDTPNNCKNDWEINAKRTWTILIFLHDTENPCYGFPFLPKYFKGVKGGILIWNNYLADDTANGFSENCVYKSEIENWFSIKKHFSFYKPEPEVIPEFNQKLINNPMCKKIDTSKLEIYEVEDFMSESECNEFLENMADKLLPSTVTNPEAEKSVRTSSTAYLKRNEFLEKLDKKFHDFIDVPQGFSEEFQGQRYLVGQEFKQHNDWFDENSTYNKVHLNMGQRTWTFMVYLNDVEEGGETEFTKLKLSIKPKKGKAVIWQNLYADGRGNPFSEHAGKPVIKGEKNIVTKWFRQRSST